MLHAHEIAEPVPSRVRLADLLGPATRNSPITGLSRERLGPPHVRVILTPAAHQALKPTIFSSHVEEGGFLIGHHHTDTDDSGRDLLVVTEVVAAVGVGSRYSFRFPGESFLHIASVVSQREPGMRLLGWYHTHVVPITVGGGLSSIDVDLHRCTFRLRWQVAALVELHGACPPLRIFYLKDGTPREATVWSLADPAQHRRPIR